MTTVVFAAEAGALWAQAIAADLAAEAGALAVRRFPDEETHVRVESNVEGKQAILIWPLDRPDPKLFPLALVVGALRDAGALGVTLVAPYLPYMRQDARFAPGETISARHLARFISERVDRLITVDPHLHRFASLGELYRIPCRVIDASGPMAAWIKANVARPLLVGPDRESEQWVREVARIAMAPHVVLDKRRHGDREVDIEAGALPELRGRTAVLVDDIVSTARTLATAAKALKSAGADEVVCVVVHALFSPGAVDALQEAGVTQVVSCDTVRHDSNRISLAHSIAPALMALGSAEAA